MRGKKGLTAFLSERGDRFLAALAERGEAGLAALSQRPRFRAWLESAGKLRETSASLPSRLSVQAERLSAGALAKAGVATEKQVAELAEQLRKISRKIDRLEKAARRRRTQQAPKGADADGVRSVA